MSDEVWKAIPDGPGFECSTHGNFRSVDRTTASGRRLKGRPLPTRVSNRGYGLVDYQNAEGKRVTRSAHTVVLETHAGPCPPGMEARHLDDNPLRNFWAPGTEEESRVRGGNLFWGTKGDQHRDKVRNNPGKPPTVPAPSFDCLNHSQCGGRVKNEGRRCVPCVEQVGRDAAAMLGRGENLMKVAQHFGYTGTDWVFTLAVKHGGYRGTRAEAQAQRRTWSRRVTTTVRDRLRRGDRESPPDAKTAARPSAKAGTAPFGRVSHMESVGQSRTIRTPSVAERNGPKVAERDRVVPLPADLALRNRPAKPRKSGRTRLGDKTS